MTEADVVVVGAGIVGAACAEALSAAGVRVLVIDRGAPASGTTAAGEGNILVSDKEPGPELDLAIASRAEWLAVLARLPERVADVEWEPKGGLVVATGEPAPLEDFAATQRVAGVDARVIKPADAFELEPLLTRGRDGCRVLSGGRPAPAGARGNGFAGRGTGSWW